MSSFCSTTPRPRPSPSPTTAPSPTKRFASSIATSTSAVPSCSATSRSRHKVTRAIRDYLSDNGFLEIETPLLTRSTPEGARDYLVPSRVHPGHFYALPQSPQIFKQILMVSGFDRYFQVARCFRDEDLRADRQPDFTQIDLEISFPQMSTIFATAEGFLTPPSPPPASTLPAEPFIQMTYDEAIRKYGIDKPDMRLPAMVDLSAELTPELRETLKIDPTLPVLGFTIPKRRRDVRHRPQGPALRDPRLLRRQRPRHARRRRASAPTPPSSPSPKPSKASSAWRWRSSTAPATPPNDLVIVITPKPGTPAMWNYDPQWIYKRVGQLRLDLAKKYADKHKLFERHRHSPPTSNSSGSPTSPCTSGTRSTRPGTPRTTPSPRRMRKTSSPARWSTTRAPSAPSPTTSSSTAPSSAPAPSVSTARTSSPRSSAPSACRDEEANERFGFFLDALEYGTPPHGGIALGLDRIVMILAGATSLREVIAFPKTAKAIDLMVDAPTPVSDTQLRDLHLKIAART